MRCGCPRRSAAPPGTPQSRSEEKQRAHRSCPPGRNGPLSGGHDASCTCSTSAPSPMSTQAGPVRPIGCCARPERPTRSAASTTAIPAPTPSRRNSGGASPSSPPSPRSRSTTSRSTSWTRPAIRTPSPRWSGAGGEKAAYARMFSGTLRTRDRIRGGRRVQRRGRAGERLRALRARHPRHAAPAPAHGSQPAEPEGVSAERGAEGGRLSHRRPLPAPDQPASTWPRRTR